MVNPKVLMQVLWQRVFMDTSKDVCTYYTLRVWEDDYGKKIIETSLRVLILNCLDFIDQGTILQTNTKNTGQCRGRVIFDLTPKCHPDIDSEGIEYSWDYANDYHIQLSLDKNKSKKNSKKSVQQAISRNKLTTNRGFMFRRHAQECIIA